MDVRVEKVDQPKRDRMKIAAAGRDETRCTVIKPLAYVYNVIESGKNWSALRT